MLVLIGCGDDGGDAHLDEDAGSEDAGVVQVSQSSLCDGLAEYDGQRVKIAGPFDTAVAGISTKLCEQCCCNSGAKHFVIDCEEGSVALFPAGGLETTEVEGVPVEPYGPAGGVRQARTTFGCAGQECFMQCTPALPMHIEAVTGRVEASEVELEAPDGTPIEYRAGIAVEALDLQDPSAGGTLTEADCAAMDESDDGSACEGEFACALGDGRRMHCVQGLLRLGGCALDGGAPDDGGVDGGLDGGPDGGLDGGGTDGGVDGGDTDAGLDGGVDGGDGGMDAAG